jgi:hypothetical protein
MLADGRCRFFAGGDSIRQLREHLIENPQVAPPRLDITIDEQLWPADENIDTLMLAVGRSTDARAYELSRRIEMMYSGAWPCSTTWRDSKLSVLGITSRFTTFLQHSMRDWLSALESLGHETQLIIEQADHDRLHPITYLQAIADFRPDLIVLIDHYRAEFPLMPQQIPAVMWVQDRLPTIFRPAAGKAQGALDYAIGYGRRDCVGHYRYPRERFMESPVGVNEMRFNVVAAVSAASSQPKQAAETAATTGEAYDCDIAFVSHAGLPIERVVREIVDQQSSPQLKQVLYDVYERLAALYAAGQWVTQEHALRQLINETPSAGDLAPAQANALLDLVSNRLNNALFRHQSIRWLTDAGFELHLYGHGWDQHPHFGKFARGVADNQRQLASIYRGARINLQITPYGSAHQRLFEGLCAGGFFLLRHVTGDAVEPMYIEIHDFIRSRDIHDMDVLRSAVAGDGRMESLIGRIVELTGENPLQPGHDFVDALRATAQGGFIRAASTLWPDEYDRVSFATRDELLDKVQYYLEYENERRAIADAMRARVVETVTYRGISRRMLSFIADDLDRQSAGSHAALAA